MKINAVTKIEIAAWLIMAAAMLYVLNYNLLPWLLAGLLVFELVHIISPYIAKKFPGLGYFSKVIAISLLAAFIVGLLTLVVLGLIAFFKSNSGSLTNLIGKMAQIIEDSRSILPDWIDSRLPADAVVLQQMVTEWLRNNASSLQFLGKEAGRYVAHMIIAMIVGGMLAFREVMTEDHYKPFAKAMVQRVRLFGCAFRNIVFAQVRISTINTVFTGIYLAIILPSAGVDLPFVKTIYISQNFIAIEKFPTDLTQIKWEDVQNEVAETIENYLSAGKPVIEVPEAVSYTNLTLPTKSKVAICVVVLLYTKHT